MDTPTTGSTQGTEQAIDDASNAAHEKIDQTSDALHPKVERIAQGAHQAVEKLAGVATQATRQWGTKSEQFKTAQQKLTEDCRVQVREKPVAALAIAAGIGFLLSRLFRSR